MFSDLGERLERNVRDAFALAPPLEGPLGKDSPYFGRHTTVGLAVSNIDGRRRCAPCGKRQRTLAHSRSTLTLPGGERETQRWTSIFIPAKMIGKHRKVQETMQTQHCFHNEIKAVTYDRQRDAPFSAPSAQSDNALINGKLGCKVDDRVSLCPNQSHLARETFLA